jgi:1-pyrroline-5-carboxylate dehydrogenase
MNVPPPVNQPVRSFAPGTPERQSLRKILEQQSNREIEIPLIIGGKEVRTWENRDIRDAPQSRAQTRNMAQSGTGRSAAGHSSCA